MYQRWGDTRGSVDETPGDPDQLEEEAKWFVDELRSRLEDPTSRNMVSGALATEILRDLIVLLDVEPSVDAEFCAVKAIPDPPQRRAQGVTHPLLSWGVIVFDGNGGIEYNTATHLHDAISSGAIVVDIGSEQSELQDIYGETSYTEIAWEYRGTIARIIMSHATRYDLATRSKVGGYVTDKIRSEARSGDSPDFPTNEISDAWWRILTAVQGRPSERAQKHVDGAPVERGRVGVYYPARRFAGSEYHVHTLLVEPAYGGYNDEGRLSLAMKDWMRTQFPNPENTLAMVERLLATPRTIHQLHERFRNGRQFTRGDEEECQYAKLQYAAMIAYSDAYHPYPLRESIYDYGALGMVDRDREGQIARSTREYRQSYELFVTVLEDLVRVLPVVIERRRALHNPDTFIDPRDTFIDPQLRGTMDTAMAMPMGRMQAYMKHKYPIDVAAAGALKYYVARRLVQLVDAAQDDALGNTRMVQELRARLKTEVQDEPKSNADGNTLRRELNKMKDATEALRLRANDEREAADPATRRRYSAARIRRHARNTFMSVRDAANRRRLEDLMGLNGVRRINTALQCDEGHALRYGPSDSSVVPHCALCGKATQHNVPTCQLCEYYICHECAEIKAAHGVTDLEDRIVKDARMQGSTWKEVVYAIRVLTGDLANKTLADPGRSLTPRLLFPTGNTGLPVHDMIERGDRVKVEIEAISLFGSKYGATIAGPLIAGVLTGAAMHKLVTGLDPHNMPYETYLYLLMKELRGKRSAHPTELGLMQHCNVARTPAPNHMEIYMHIIGAMCTKIGPVSTAPGEMGAQHFTTQHN
jgi:hypothetical protein